MENVENIKIGSEVIYLDFDGEKQTTTIIEIKDKTFTCKNKIIYVNKWSNTKGVTDHYQTFYTKSGKKASRHYTHGDVIEVVKL